jgi:hypothetical protein
MAGPKRHHFVPRFYLERFAEGGVLYVRWRDGREFRTGAGNIAVRSGFYDLTSPDGETSKDVEDWLEKIETPASAAMRHIDDTLVAPGLDDSDRIALSLYLAIQLARTPEQRERVMFPEQVTAFLAGRELTKDLIAEYLQDTHLGFTPEAGEVQGAFDFASYMLPGDGTVTPELSMQILFRTSRETAPALACMHWSVEHDRKGRLITSDGPLVLWRTPSPRDSYEGLGLNGCEEIRFPLDPFKQLVLTPKPRPASVRISPQRAAACNQDLAYACHNFVVASPREQGRTEQLDLPKKRPVMRFNSGPLFVEQPDGTLASDTEVLHTWVPRR